MACSTNQLEVVGGDAMTDIKPGMLVRWKDWRTLGTERTGLVFDVYDAGGTPFASPSVTVIWSGQTELEHCFLRFLEPVTDEH